MFITTRVAAGVMVREEEEGNIARTRSQALLVSRAEPKSRIVLGCADGAPGHLGAPWSDSQMELASF